jgi:predicted nucleotidyltransferase
VESLRNLVEAHHSEIIGIARSHRAISISLFGSAARGEDSSGSDLDFLVELEPGASLFDLGGTQYDLSHLLGVEVDVVEVRGLREADEHILRDAVLL